MKEIPMNVNEFVNVKDIKDIFLYTRNQYIFCYLRIFPFNLDLLSSEERKALTDKIAASFDGDRKDFVYSSLPRELDLDRYKSFLKQKRMEQLDDMGKKHIIDILHIQATELSGSRENYEHQHYYKIWSHIYDLKNKSTVEAELKERLVTLHDIYQQAQIPCEIMKEKEIIKLCNLYSNSRSANFDVAESLLQSEIPTIR